MPSPVYIICAQNISVDRETNLVSFFNVIDQINVEIWDPSQSAAQPKGTAILAAKVVSAWKVNPLDEGKDYETETEIETPSGDILTTGITEFKFNVGTKLHRINTDIAAMPPMIESGVLKVTNRIKKKKSRMWMSQAAEIPVEVTNHSGQGKIREIRPKQKPQGHR